MPRPFRLIARLLLALALLAPTLSARPLPARAYEPGVTGDPWKMLVLVYTEIDADYIDIDGTTKHLRATMPADQRQQMVQAFLNLPHRGAVYDFSDHAAELEAHIVYVDRPITHLSEVGEQPSYWPGPDDTLPEIEKHAPPGMYDSILVFWQASDPVTGQSVPSGGWGWGGWVGPNGMTYASVFNLPYAWPSGACRGEVFLHEWLHGVTGFYSSRGFPFPFEDLHGAEEAGYAWSDETCWGTWLRDYMRGLVVENGRRTALVPETWRGGSITTHNILGWRGEYYNNPTLADLPVVVRDDPALEFNWEDRAPHPLLVTDSFSARWTRVVDFGAFPYRFDLFHDDGVRLLIDGELVYENWCDNCYQTDSRIRQMTAGPHTVRVEMFENAGWAGASLSWQVDDQVPPTGAVLLPAENAGIEPGPVTITAEAADNMGVSEVEFHVYYNGAWRMAGKDATAPYAVRWVAPDDLPDQEMLFSIHVKDLGGNEVEDPGGYHHVRYATCTTCMLADSFWPQARGGLKKDGRSRYQGPKTPGLAWTQGGEGNGTAPVVGPDGVVYAGMGKTFAAYRPDGTRLWAYTAPDTFTASPVLTAGGKIFVPNNDGKLYALRTDGTLAWTFATGGWIGSAPVVAPDGVIYFGSSDTYLYALTPTGRLKWKFQAGLWINSSPAVGADGTIYFGCTDQSAYAVTRDGRLRWKHDVGGYVDASPAIGPDGSVYFLTVNGKLSSFDPGGALRWTFDLGGDTNQAQPAVGAYGDIYAASSINEGAGSRALYAITPAGQQKWRVPLPADSHSAPTIAADGTLYLPLDNSHLLAYSPAGRLRWDLPLENYSRLLRHNPAIGPNGTIYVGAFWPARLFAVQNTNRVYIPVAVQP